MTRRRTVALVLVGLVTLSGCLGAASFGPAPNAGPEDGPEPGPDTDDAKQFTRTNASDPVPLDRPPAPETLTNATAGEYAAAFEEVRMHNELLSDVEAEITEIGTGCTVAAVEPDGEAYRVTVECGRWYEFQSGDAVGIADGAPYSTTSLVAADGIEQVGEPEPVV